MFQKCRQNFKIEALDLLSSVTQESTSIGYITSGKRFVIYICQTRLIIIGSEMLKNSSFVNSSLRVIFDT